MARPKKGLGRGLGAIFGDVTFDDPAVKTAGAEGEAPAKGKSSKKKSEKAASGKAGGSEGTAEASKAENKESGSAETGNGEVMVKLSDITPNENQPREDFDEEALRELTDSVRNYGVLQPILVKKEGKGYRIIAGERRYRAAKEAGLKEVPVVIREYSEQQASEVALIENVQRSDLNPVEEAKGYQTLIETYGLTQEDIASRIGKNRTTITNALRLLKLDPEVLSEVRKGTLSAGHARTLVALEDPEVQKTAAKEVLEKGMSVRQTEALVRSLQRTATRKRKPVDKGEDLSIYYKEYEEQMKTILGTRVHINRRDKNKGRIEIEYYSVAELERLMELFGGIKG